MKLVPETYFHYLLLPTSFAEVEMLTAKSCIIGGWLI